VKLLDLARSGGLDGQLLSAGGFYQTDYSKPLLFLAACDHDRARRQFQLERSGFAPPHLRLAAGLLLRRFPLRRGLPWLLPLGRGLPRLLAARLGLPGCSRRGSTCLGCSRRGST